MGRLHYGGNEAIEFPDRMLAHLRVLMTSKLRRSESFTVSWRHGEDDADGRSMIWVHPSIPFRFVFDSAAPEVLDRKLLEELAQSAMATGGVTLDLMSMAAPVAERRHLERAA